ncbi:hypothetical protein [Lactococcus lactis]|uniref:Uncharacterized protein n=2 Tax=Lactococcus lactis TaxID=1358 RepID=A0AAW7IX33_9LACT|nr:hypothetical protein [Lactococcus lactis]KST76339.1 hypothetical protein ATCC19435_2517 [Lactococcus lactis subsp. lactis]MBU3885770.1 hypothetical protein [Lactococcus lactis]MCT0051052.1 hypothetical protein [Lactococcus lactis subsp. lactis]MCT0061794.1 hypothetical protein [Lactococcus lactis subsp. lactis]MCT0138238.1 hypothetical protein [Lactococcus lactis subsp. lactis]
MEIINIGLGIRQKNGKTYIASLSNSKKVAESIESEISESYSELNYQIVEPFDSTSLIDETEYYLDLEVIGEEDLLYNVSKLLGKENLLQEADVLKLDESRLKNLKSNKESVRFFVIELDEEYLFLAVNSRATIKGRNFLNLSVGSKNNTIEIDYGVHIPCEITAVLEKENSRLYVMNVLGFENMLGLKYAKKEQAEEVLKSFLAGNLTIGKEEYKVSFQEYDKIHSTDMVKARNINRLSSYKDGQADFEIEKIKNAVNKLQENQRVEFKDKEIIVNSENFRTFTAILHNSIVLRLISGDYNII